MGVPVDTPEPRRLGLLLAHCTAPRARRPVVDRLREQLGAELARLLLFGLARDQRLRSARRG